MTGYILRLGTSLGGNDLYGSGPLTATSATPTNLPTNGKTIHARLYTIYASGAQAYTDYTFPAATSAAMLTPVPGTVLPNTLDFEWSAATGDVTSYDLRLGTSVGAYNLLDSGQVTATFVYSGILPVSGEKIYARLLTIYPSGAQVYNDYTFTAAP